MSQFETRKILGIQFFTGTLESAVEHSLKGGLVVAPSGPGLAADLLKSVAYRRALTTADLVITDSGWMILLWRYFTGEYIPRHSGLKLMRALLDRPELKRYGTVFWVMPSIAEKEKNLHYLRSIGFPITNEDAYLAPHYSPMGELRDDTLIKILQDRKPSVIMLAIGGGVQERLGLTLRESLTYQPAIFCLGAAIAFLSGGQTNIPPWADKFYLGWLFRLISDPKKYWIRYWDAFGLFTLINRYRDQIPPLHDSK
ncbi:MAG: WecB/TagA/CpsF family glycosyltransferase [Verrucomicrobia bacterium]|nr:WecB/TagA/CpsF family glycosyltransferase [Verrucomicrobiota bacterium]